MSKIIRGIKKLFFNIGKKTWKSAWLFSGRQYFLKKRKFILIISLPLLIIIYFLFLFLSVSPSRLELAELKKAMKSTGPCHEDCLLARQLVEERIASALKNDRRLKDDIKKYLLEQDINISNLEFKRELLEIIHSAYGPDNPPDFIINYLIDKNGDVRLKAEIIRIFLADSNEPSLTEYYFALLNSGEDSAIKEEAVKALSNLTNKADIFNQDEIEMLKDLILKDNQPLNLKSDILFLLSDYFLLFPEKTKSALTEIYISASEPIIKAFAADILNNFGYSEFIGPEISADQWFEYFNN